MNSSSLTQAIGFVSAVCPVCQNVCGAQPGPAPAAPLDLAGIQQCLNHQHLIALPSREQEGQRPSAPVTLQVDFGSETALRAAKRLVAGPFFAPAAL